VSGLSDEAAGIGCIVVAILGAALWLCWANGPVSWFFLAAAAGYWVGRGLRAKAHAYRETTNSFKARVAEAATDDACFFLLCLTIGICFVFLLQLILRTGVSVGPDSFANFERGTWNFLLTFKHVLGSPAFLMSVIAGSLAFGIILKTWFPAVMAGRLRKWAGGIATILASALMFSFVTGAAAEARYPETTGGLRAAIVERLDKTAEARRDAVAYHWAQAILERKMADADWRGAAIDLARKAGAECRKTDALVPVARDAASGHLPRLLSCNQAVVEANALEALLPERSNDFASNPDYPAEAKPAWLPELEASLSPREGEVLGDDLSVRYDLKDKLISVAELDNLRAKVEAMAVDADAGRTAMRGGLLKIVTGWLNEQLPIPGLADRIVDTLRDAMLSQLAKDGDRLVRQRLAALRDKTAAEHNVAGQAEIFPDPALSKFALLGVLQPAIRARVAKEIVMRALPERAALSEIYRQTGDTRAFQVEVSRQASEARAATANAAIESRRYRPPPQPYRPRPRGR
jgi:hypothetical protein